MAAAELAAAVAMWAAAGLQIGVSSSDVIMLVMNERGMKRMTEDKFTIGADATAAAGPVGRNATAQTDAMMTAEILSWSRARGAFVGASLDGATMRSDVDQNEAMYGKRWTSRQILNSGATAPRGGGEAARFADEILDAEDGLTTAPPKIRVSVRIPRSGEAPLASPEGCAIATATVN